MSILMTCQCGRKLRAREEHAGRTVKCPECGSEMRVPDADEEPDDDRAATSQSSSRRRDDGEEDEERIGSAAAPKTSGKALASLLLGLAFPLVCLTGIPAVILGIMALSAISSSRGRLSGTGLAIAGMILGGLATLLTIPALLMGLLVPAVAKVREAGERVQQQNNLKQIALAMHTYHDLNNELPPSVVYDQNGKPLYSWRVLLLPYLKGEMTYNRVHLDEAWDSPHNRTYLTVTPRPYASPGDSTAAGPNLTYYQVFDGPGAIFDSTQESARPLTYLKTNTPVFAHGPKVTLASIQDGTSQTLLVVEAADPVPWAKPGDIPFRTNQPLPRLGFNLKLDRFNAAFADGSVRPLRKNMAETNLRALITRNGGETVSLD